MAPDTGLLSARPRQARPRALVKTACYSLLMLATTVLVAWAVVGNARTAVDVGLAANVPKTGTYYGHKRLWDRVSWGTVGE